MKTSIDFSLKIKMIFLMSLIVVVSVVVIATAFVSHTQRQIQDEFDIRIQSAVDAAAKNLELSVMIKQVNEIEHVLKTMLHTPDLVSVSVYDEANVLLSTHENRKHLPLKAKTIQQKIIVDEVQMDELQMLEDEHPMDKHEVVGSVVALFSIERMEQDLNEVIKFSFQLTLVVIIIAIIIGYYFANALTKPLAQLVDATQKVAEGDLSYTVPNKASGEIGHLSYSFGIMVSELANDIARREKVERQLRESKLRFQALANKAPVGILQFTALGECVFVNPRGLEILDAVEEDVLERSWLDRIHPDDKELVSSQWNRCITQRKSFYSEFRFIHPGNESVWVIGEVHPELNDSSEVSGYIGTIADVTPLKLITEELKRSNDELESFARIASHDLKEPMRKIQSFGSILEEDFSESLGESGRAYLERIINAAQRMQALIDGLLAYSRITTKPNPFCPLGLENIVFEVISDLEIALKQSAGSVTVGELPEVLADPLQMRQLMQNLIGNSIKYHRDDLPPVVEITGCIVNDMLEVTVSDNGIGFDDRYAERIFGVFERLHGRSDKYEGTGVGLSICKKIVERHGGSIHAYGKCGEGSKFVFTLPLHKGKANV
ncbi:MAG: ATP-binding protein [Candidatus Polarisedimenticolaceae bacterium]|nr:ATP-binding protein [Candidatus Polarisedimenticolaceae bacterium]